MIEIKCPACGSEGRAPADKVNTRLVCRKCLKVFHVTASGRAVPGEPPAPGAVAHELSVPDSTMKVDQWFERVGQWFFSPKNIAKLLALLALAGLSLYFTLRRSESLEERAIRVARATVEGDLQSIRNLAAAGASEDVMKWYDSVRDQCNALRQQLGSNKLKIEVDIRQQDAAQGTADVVAHLNAEEQLERKAGVLPDATLSTGPASSQSVAIPMAWKSEGWSGWKLDGRRTLNLAATPQ